MHHPSQQTYSLRLRAPANDPEAIAGVIEQVLSGERRSFDSAAALIACLQALQALQRSQLSGGQEIQTPPSPPRWGP